jgi:putative acetyltransferase
VRVWADGAVPAVAGSVHEGPATVTTTIRPAGRDDAPGILAVVEDSFSYRGTRDAGEELAIVRDTWSAQKDRPLIELVADEQGAVVGHLQAAPGSLDGLPSPVAGVAPVCVGTAHQGKGVGSALMGALIDAATGQRWPLLVLLGDPAYYGRFGFEPAVLPDAQTPRLRRGVARGVQLLLGMTVVIIRRQRRRRPARAAGAECPRSP